MPYKHRDPVPEEEMVTTAEMERERYKGHHSICQTLRDIYSMTDDSEIKLKCRVGVAMAKAMHEKLKWYSQKEGKNE